MSTDNKVKPWRLSWSPEQVERFWNWWGSNPDLERHYFSKRNGAAVLQQIGRFVSFSGMVIDLGAGPGHIVDLLLSRRVRTLAVDTSAESLAVLERRVAGNAYFLGAKASTIDSVPLPDGCADGVLLIETIEHLGDDALGGLLHEAVRITRPGGWVAVTTPNDERLGELETMCPNCGCVYHYYQHVRSWSAGTLVRFMKDLGLTTIVCKPTLFSHFPSFLRFPHRLAYSVLSVKLPHLLYVGRKAVQSSLPS